jgi:hypothetical protein
MDNAGKICCSASIKPSIVECAYFSDTSGAGSLPEQSTAKEPEGPTRLLEAPELHPLERQEPSAQIHSIFPHARDTVTGDDRFSAPPKIHLERVEGSVDSLTPWGATGWAWVPAAPDEALEIEAVLNGKIIGRDAADRMRPDLVKLGKRSGLCSFSLGFQEAVDGDSVLILRAVGPQGATVLSGCKWSNVAGYIDLLTRLGTSGWAWMPVEPDGAFQVEAVLEDKVIGRALADQMRPDIASSGRGFGRCGFNIKFDEPITDDEIPILRVLGPGPPTIFRSPAKRSSEITPAPFALIMDSPSLAERSPDQDPEALRRSFELNLIAKTGLFDDQYYLARYPDIAEAGISALEHFYDFGFLEGRRPNFYFDPLWYLDSNQDVKQARIHPLVHYITHGDSEGRKPSLNFDSSWYRKQNNIPDSENALLHYLKNCKSCQFAPIPEFDIEHYARSYPDIVAAGIDPFEHFVSYGYREGRSPSLQFDANFYWARYLDGDRSVNPFLHFLAHKHGPGVVGRMHDDEVSIPREVAPPKSAPEGHVDSITRRGARGWAWLPLSPDTVAQVEAVLDARVIGRASADRLRPDLLESNIGTGRYGFAMSFDEPVTGDRAPEFRVLIPSQPYLPGVKTLPALTPEDCVTPARGSIATWYKEHAKFTSRGPEYEEFDGSIISGLPAAADVPRPLLLAFYLPQYHAIPENDQFWGKGFTEWRQIARGASRFPGHYQPRIPRDLGFYDLSSLSTLRAQAELAKGAGIQAFAYYYYWFNGKRVLEKPLNMLLESDLEMPFMILWANENWTRTWDGSEHEVLLKQDYRREDEDALLKDLSRHFLDARYVRVAGRPLFCIYNPDSIPEPVTTIGRWRKILGSRCAIEPLIFMAQTFGARDPREFGCDGALEFPPHKTAEKLVGRLTPDAYSPGYSSQILAYDDFVDTSLNEVTPEYPLIKTAVPSWDNESRRPNRSLTLEGLSPAKYQAWLRSLLLRAIDKTILGTPIVAINAWNEWAEAAYLEPDVYYGASYLNATARAYVSAVNDYASAVAAVNKAGSSPPM